MNDTREMMTPNPVTVIVEESLVDAWDLMRELDIRHVPAIQDGALVGMLSARDLGHLDMTRMAMGEGANAVRREPAVPAAPRAAGVRGGSMSQGRGPRGGDRRRRGLMLTTVQSGRTILNGPSAELLQSAEVKRIFLGDLAL